MNPYPVTGFLVDRGVDINRLIAARMDVQFQMMIFKIVGGCVMAKITKTVVVTTCDRCGAEGDTGSDETKQEWGEMDIQYKGHVSGRTWQGDAGGIRYSEKVWLCLSCTKKFLEFMKN
jgi:hypothetical protein